MENKLVRDQTDSAFFEKVELFHEKVIKPIFPFARSRSNSTGLYDPEIGPTAFSSELSENNLFKNSIYEHKGLKKYLHFTSLHGLSGILNNGFLRMSEFGNLVDENEITYGASVFHESNFTMNPANFEELKRNIFCLSLCAYNERIIKNQIMWELYGDKGHGVSIELKINSPDPSFYQFGKIQYGTKGLKPLFDLKNNYFEYLETGSPVANNFLELTTSLQAFHKTEYYSSEKEVRLFYRPSSVLSPINQDPTVYSDINGNGKIKRFKKLYLNGRHEVYNFNKDKFTKTEIFNLFPEIEIKRIILGPKYKMNSPEDQYSIVSFLKELKLKYNYKFSLACCTFKGEIIEIS